MIARLLASRVAIALVAALVGAGVVAAIWALSSGGNERQANGEVRLSFEPTPNRRVAAIERSGAFQQTIATVNRELNLPVDLHVKFVGATTAARVGVSGPTFVPADRTVYFPWSFIDHSLLDLETLPQLRHLPPAAINRRLANAMTFVLLHELAHGLVDVLDVPTVASQESVAENLAAIFAIASRRGGEVVPLTAAALHEAHANHEGSPTLSAYADDHGFSRQRAFDALCLVYGSAPRRFAELVTAGRLPASRAEICPFDYQHDLRAWRRLLGAWLTQTGGLRPLPR